MPHLDKSFFENIHGYTDSFFKDYSVFIETGTYLGKTTLAIEPLFQEIYTIEIKEELYHQAKNNYLGDKINFLLGDSSHLLEKVCNNVNKKAIFFLDGHWSMGETGRGKKDCPLYEEIEQIIRHFKLPCIIIIDDYRLFGKGPSTGTEQVDWENISKRGILNIVKDRITLQYHLPSHINKLDRFVLHIE